MKSSIKRGGLWGWFCWGGNVCGIGNTPRQAYFEWLHERLEERLYRNRLRLGVTEAIARCMRSSRA